MHANSFNTQERKERKRSRMIAFFFATALIAGIFLPFMTGTEPDKPKYESVVTVDFSKTEFEKSSAKPSESGARGGKPEPKKPEPQPETKPQPPAPPVVTTPQPAPPVKTTPTKTPPPPKRPTKPTPPVSEPKDAVKVPKDTRVSSPKDSKAPDNNNGQGSGAGTSGDGKANGNSDGKDTTPGDGDEGLDFSGDGIFGRRVTYRADIAKITEEAGKIVVNLCINRTGRVVYAKNNTELSTISTAHIVNKAVATAKRYRFDTDYTAPEKECGKLTFIFKLN